MTRHAGTAGIAGVGAAVGRAAAGVRWWVRGVMGDDAYRRYVAHVRAAHPDADLPSESQYWRERYARADAEPGARCC